MSERTGRVDADRIVLSYRAAGVDPDEPGGWKLADSDWIRDRITEETYLTYLRRVHGGEVDAGEEWEEFVTCGCTSPRDVVVRVEMIEGGTDFGEETEIEIRPRAEFLVPS